MFQRLRRPSILLLAILLPAALTLAACGSDGDGGEDQLSGLKAVSISGSVGTSPKLDWKGLMKPEAIASKVIADGDGAGIAKGDRVQVQWSLINGYTHNVIWDTYDDEKLSTVVKVGETPQPSSLADVLSSVVASEIKPGQTLGSRLAITVGSDRVIGQYIGTQAGPSFAQLGIGNQDGLLFVADLSAPAAPQGKARKPAAGVPAVVEKAGVPASLNFTKAAAPSGKLKITTLVQGTGARVKKGQQVAVSYLGQIPKATSPFDENFSTGGTYQTEVGPKATGSIKGWMQGLVGVRVGS
ncbi:MAG: FKBP-type peptidyl-prolyl cis-trans isomerase, partial [Nocardioidaceae bacterium]|nr:FKBP-type peptidyl-prolyl cis-trans isomerase [Nocardioidaceae bacterium]